VVAHPRRHDHQVFRHFITGEELAELGDEQAACRCPVSCCNCRMSSFGGVADEVTQRPFFLRLLQARLNDLDDGLGALGSLTSAWVKPSSTSGNFSNKGLPRRGP